MQLYGHNFTGRIIKKSDAYTCTATTDNKYRCFHRDTQIRAVLLSLTDFPSRKKKNLVRL